MSISRQLVRVALGMFCIAHALAHAVLPEHGALGYPWGTGLSVPVLAAYTLTLGALFTAGLGLLGVRPLRSSVTPLVALGLASSVALLLLRWDPSGWWGLAIDAALAGAFVAARNTRLLESEEPPQTVRRGEGRPMAG